MIRKSPSSNLDPSSAYRNRADDGIQAASPGRVPEWIRLPETTTGERRIGFVLSEAAARTPPTIALSRVACSFALNEIAVQTSNAASPTLVFPRPGPGIDWDYSSLRAGAVEQGGNTEAVTGSEALHVTCMRLSSATNRGCSRSGARRNDPFMPYTGPVRRSTASSRQSMARSTSPSPV